MIQMHFYLFLRTIVSFLVFNAFITSTISKSLPRLRIGSQSPAIYTVGSDVRIICPIFDDNNPDMLFIEWFREKNDPVIESPRIRVNDKGVLKIKSAIVDDSGIYYCKGINGFGSETTSIKLQIVPEEDLHVPSVPLDNQYPLQYPQNDNIVLESDVNPGYIPKKIDSRSTFANSVPRIIEKPVGATLTLNCNTNARVRWTKNGKQVTHLDLPHGSSKRRGVLNISKVRIEDSGNYSCISIKSWPQVNNTFTLIVYDKPELTAFHPINTSVVLGERAIFHCKVRSEVKPFIQWLGSVTNVKDTEEAKSRGLIQISSQFYRVMKSTKIIETEDGNYYKDLIIEETKLNDSGNYVCFAAYYNPGSFNFSYTYKSTYLTVLTQEKPTESTTEIFGGLSISTYFWISCGIVTTVVGSLIWLLYRLQKNYENRVNTTHNNNNIERVDNIVDKPRDYNIHYYFGPEPSLTHSGYTSGVVNTNGDNSSTDRFTYQT